VTIAAGGTSAIPRSGAYEQQERRMNSFEREVKDAIALGAFVYVRCACRVHKTLPMLGDGRCGACHEMCDRPSTREEYDEQEIMT
jgi:hypothetical protein